MSGRGGGSTVRAGRSPQSVGRLRARMRNLTLRHKLLAITMVTCVAALVLAGIILLSYYYVGQRRQMVQQAEMQAEMIALNCQAALAFNAPDDAQEILGSLRAMPTIAYACIRDAEGETFSSYRGPGIILPEGADQAESRLQDAGVGRRYLKVVQPVHGGEGREVLGTVAIWSDMAPVRDTVERYLLTMVGVMSLVALAAYGIASRIQGIISTPILSLAGVAHRVSEGGEYSLRAQRYGDDEVGFLIDAFNGMLEQIQQRDLALVAANEKLEARVQERTARLSEANTQLKAEIGHRNRAERALRERTERVIRHQTALLTLSNVEEPDREGLFQVTAREVARTLGTERVGVWQVAEDGTTLSCASLYVLSRDSYEPVPPLDLTTVPRYMQSLEASRIVAVDEVDKDPRTRELVENYLEPHGVTALMNVPLRMHGRLVGVLCHEHTGSARQWSLEEQDFTASVADLLMLKLERLERQRVQSALRDSERRYRTLLKNVPQKIFYKDINCVYLLCNESYADDLGLALPDDIRGKTDFDFHPEHLARQYVADDRRIMASGRPEEIEESYLLDGRELTIQTLKSPVRDEDGHVIGIFGIFWDITERKRAAEALADLNHSLETTVQELRRSNRELQDFSYVTAHDLKAPLRAIGTLADWIHADYYETFDEQGREQMQLIKGRVARMSELIDSILRYAEIGRGPRHVQAVRLDALVAEVIRSLDIPDGFDVQVEGPLPTLRCERARLMQVFQHLLGNAVKHMDKPEGRVHIAATERPDCWEFCIADNGPGIEARYFEKIFKMFQTLTPRDELESTGIGLALVRKIVELYGGQIWVESQPGQGAAFHFTMAKSESRADGRDTAATPAHATGE